MDSPPDPPPSFASILPSPTTPIKPSSLLQSLSSFEPFPGNSTPAHPLEESILQFTDINTHPASPPGPHTKLTSFPHDTILLPPPSQSAETSSHLRNTVGRDSFARHLVGADGEECQGADEIASPFLESLNSESYAKFKEKRESELKAIDKAKEKGEEESYFGSESKMRVDSLRNSPSKGKWLKNDADDGKGMAFQTSMHQGGLRQQLEVTWGSGGELQTPILQTGVTGYMTSGSTLACGDVDGWGKRLPEQEFEAGEENAQKGWGYWSAGRGNNTNGPWGLNISDGRAFEGKKEGLGHVRSRHQSLVQNPTQDLRQNYSHRAPGQPFGAEQQVHIAPQQQSEATIRPISQFQHRLPRNDLPAQETRVHYHTYLNRPQNQNTQIQAKEAELIEALHYQSAIQEELSIQQRIRIAVLENDLKHTKKAKEDALNASLIIAQVLGLASCGQSKASHREIEKDIGDEVKELKRQVQILTMENKILCAGGPEKKGKTDAGLDESASDEEAKSPRTPLHTPARRHIPRRHLEDVLEADEDGPRLTAIERGKGKERVETSKTEPGALTKERFRPAFKKPSESANTTKGVSGWNESLTTDVPTVPNSPVLLSTSQVLMSSVGLQSLDDFLAGDMNDHPPKEEIILLSPQLEAQIRALQNMANIPAPSVLKTGFDIKMSKRGAEYDHTLPQAPVGSGGMGGFGRFNTANTLSMTTAHEFWTSPEERKRVLQDHQRQCGRERIRYPDMFRYGIQYTPEEDDENYFRTVVISNLPGDVELREVLARVRGGLVASAILMDTKRLMGGNMSAMVVFVEDYDAQAFVDYVATLPITFTNNDKPQQAIITLVPAPTYPMNQGIKLRMKTGRKDTRCLAIYNVPENLSLSRLEYDIACNNAQRADNLIKIYIDEDNTLHLEFSNLSLAGSAFGILTNWRSYMGLNVAYAADPCTGPLEELALPVPPRPPKFPQCHLPSPPYDPNSSPDSLHEQSNRFSGIGGNMIVAQRKRLAALSNQKVEIPPFSCSGIQSSSWADEVIEESELSEPNAPSSSNPTYPAHHMDHEEHDEPPHTHSEAPPNFPVNGVLPMTSPSSTEVKEAVDAIMTDNVNALTKENPSSFRKAPVGLSGSKYATAVPRFSDRRSPLRVRSTRQNLAKVSARESGDELFQDGPESWNAHRVPTASEKGKGRYTSPSPSPSSQPLPELELASLLAAALYSSSEYSTQPESSSTLSSPKSPPSPNETLKPIQIPFRFSTPDESYSERTPKASTYVLKKPTYEPECSPVQKSPSRQSKYPALHGTTPLENFNRDMDAKETNPALSTPANKTTPATPCLAFSQPAPRTPQKPHQNAEVYAQQVAREHYPESKEVPEGQWTKEDVETLKNSSPDTKERYVKLMELGRGVGEFGGPEEMIPELRLGSPESGNSAAAGSDPFSFLSDGKTKLVVGREGGKRKSVDKSKKKINPDEIGLDMDDDMEDVGAESGVHDSGRMREKRPCTYRRESTDPHVASCEGYMSIGG